MSLKHKALHQINGEFVCTHCGKSWETNDVDPPDCTPSPVQASPVQFIRLSVDAGKTTREQFEQAARMVTQWEQRTRAGPLTHEEVTEAMQSFKVDANVAWMLTQGGREGGTATVIYASSRADANKYVQRLIGVHPCVELYRLKAMDEFAIGSAPYFELNPDKLKRAAKAQRCKVISFHRFKEYVI